MAWFRVDDGTPNSDWVLRIPRAKRVAAVGLWTLAGAWSARNDTDGFVPTYAVSEWQTADKLLRFMTESGVWFEVDGGWQFTKWAPDQTTAKDRMRKAEGNAARQAGWRERHNSVSNALRADVTEPLVTAPVPTRPVPTRPVPKEQTASSAAPKVDELFDQFWAGYPRKVGKEAARKAFRKACTIAPAFVITSAARRYGEDPNLPEQTYIPHPATWLSQGRWDDGPQATRPLFPGPGPRPTLDDKVAGTLARAEQLRAAEEAAEQDNPWNTRRQLGTA